MEAGWIRIRGRRQAPGRPVTFGTTDGFLRHFGLNSVTDLPGLEELRAVGLLRADPPDGFTGEDSDEDDDDAEDEDICDQFDLDDLFAQDGEESAGGEPGDDEPGERRE
jgi:segregation and condensation protein B